MNDTPNRCRLVLITPPGLAVDDAAARLKAALSGGDVASVIVPQYEMDETGYQTLAGALTPLAQEAGAAVMIAGDSRVAGRVKADGIHVEGGSAALAETIGHHGGKMLVGAGGIRSRDDALELGEEQPDYVFFGRFGYDNQPQAHPRNVALAEWWAQMIELPCVVLAGTDPDSVEAIAATGAEFVAMSAGVFADTIDPAAAVAKANARLDETAPRFEAEK
ncbi:MAG: thiamine phosphate synthase [Rhizobiaceae bacterium]|nr:thiamine phosphate synthase [Rhizobiaceae bacterium]